MPALSCEVCQSPFTPDDLQPSLGLATCRRCQRVQVLGRSTPVAASSAPLSRPMAWTESVEGGTLVLRRKWRSRGTMFPVIFAGFWNVFMVSIWVGLVTGAVAQTEGGPPSFFLLIPHTMVGLGTAYWAISGLLNSTTVRVDAAAISVQHAPLPWLGSQTIPRDQVRQLFVSRSSVKVNRQSTYNLCYLDGARVIHTLIGRRPRLDEQRWLEQRIESHLGIRDEAVAEAV
jgi:hypothetical protein